MTAFIVFQETAVRYEPRLPRGRLGAVLLLGFWAVVSSVAAVAQEIPPDSPVAEALRRANARVEKIVAVDDDRRTFDNTAGAIDDLIVHLRLDTEELCFLAYVSGDPDERQRGERAEEDVARWRISLSKREDLYQAVKAYADAKPKLTGERKRLLEHMLRDYRRAGMELPKPDRQRLTQLQIELNKLELEFSKNIRQDATRVLLTAAELQGLPEEFLSQLDRSGDLYIVGMDYPTMGRILRECQVETTRQKLFVARNRRGGARNVELLQRILRLRDQAATMLGYRHTADYRTEVRMAKNADAVLKFYDELRPLVRKKAQQDFDLYVAAKRKHTGDRGATLRRWDTGFYHQRLLAQEYGVDAETLRQYFPLDRVIDGVFHITQTVFGIEYRDVTGRTGSTDRPLWHADVKHYEVWDKASSRLMGEIFLDLHPREDKYNHAACFDLRPRKRWSDGKVQTPQAALVCNFTKPVGDKPALLTHWEVETFFHEFGHGLHDVLAQAEFGRFSGTSVSRDFVEAPSQMLENWAWDAGMLKRIMRHYKTGEAPPDKLIDGLVRSQRLGTGLWVERQFHYGLLDLAFHTAPQGKIETTKTALDLEREVTLFEPAENTFMQASFGHLMGYHAGYYSYMWSLVYAQDMFSRFRRSGLLDAAEGRRYRQKILARGGSVDEMDMLEDYLGRRPKRDAFLEHLGLEQ